MVLPAAEKTPVAVNLLVIFVSCSSPFYWNLCIRNRPKFPENRIVIVAGDLKPVQ